MKRLASRIAVDSSARVKESLISRGFLGSYSPWQNGAHAMHGGWLAAMIIALGGDSCAERNVTHSTDIAYSLLRRLPPLVVLRVANLTGRPSPEPVSAASHLSALTGHDLFVGRYSCQKRSAAISATMDRRRFFLVLGEGIGYAYMQKHQTGLCSSWRCTEARGLLQQKPGTRCRTPRTGR